MVEAHEHPPSPLPLAGPSRSQRERDLRATASDTQRFHRALLLRGAASFAVMLLCHSGELSPVWLFVANLVIYPEVYLRVHDIGHCSSFRELGWAARFIPVANPIWGGTRVFAVIHREHHKYLGTSRDPWLPYYAGHPLRALCFNFIEPEYSCREFIRRKGVDCELALNLTINMLALCAGLWLWQWTYAAYVLSQRVVHMVGIFFFNFYTHRASFSASAPIGTWERERPLRRVAPLLRAIWGDDTIDGLVFHNRHHCLGQQHVPVQHYKQLEDTGEFTSFDTAWPITSVRELPTVRVPRERTAYHE
jgi:hypothetical protein